MRQHLSFFEDWRDFGNQQKFVKFLKLRPVLILRYLLTDLLLTQIKFALVRPGPYTPFNQMLDISKFSQHVYIPQTETNLSFGI